MTKPYLKTIDQIIEVLTPVRVTIADTDSIHRRIKGGDNLTYILRGQDPTNPDIDQLLAQFKRAQVCFELADELYDDYATYEAQGKITSGLGLKLKKEILGSLRATVKELKAARTIAQRIKADYTQGKAR